ncbi:rpm1-interacting protein 4 [Phtheirospermum japonicum]|uniref:Rpm1-interacting protein 4 n=1 Tax=Phtheirospermum japonicum TaxID=374723 RepID=A0A830DD81_9LAMI|nr:rpm1-interacting protein 4 [Phtheirospermum japonicum]
MAERSPQVPKFGNWEGEEIPYTICFDNARKETKSGPTQAQQKDQKASEPKRHYYAQTGNDKPRVETPKAALEALKPRPTREEDEMKKLVIDSPLRQERNSSNSPRHRYGGSSAGDTPRIVGRRSVGSDRSVDHSPLHPHSQAKTGGRNGGVSSPSWERKATSDGVHGLAPSTPGRSRLRSVTRGDDSPDRSPAVPKFGAWDETDPASAEGYTQIFNRVREEKHTETGKVPVLPTETPLPNAQKQYGNGNPKLPDADVLVCGPVWRGGGSLSETLGGDLMVFLSGIWINVEKKYNFIVFPSKVGAALLLDEVVEAAVVLAVTDKVSIIIHGS